jgi:threonine synthase
MRYISTRGGGAPRRFSEILLDGLAPDGGLYMPESLPVIGPDTLRRWRGLTYADLAFEILSIFADDIQADDLARIVAATYTEQVFGDKAITPVLTLEPGLHLLRLSNGPTLAFKDIAMQLLGRLFERALAENGERLNILGATSGDTGSAAEHAMRGRRGISVYMLSPDGRMSAFQRAQMYGLSDPNIHNLAVEGDFDTCQALVKRVSADAEFKQNHRIGTVNSINWARVAAQIVYYFKAWGAVATDPDEPVSFAVPSGNFGNICAGHIARQMGLPVDRLILATNENDVLDEFFRTGQYRPRGLAEATSSPSMDISRASNLERFVFDLVGRDSAELRRLFGQGSFDLAGTPWFETIGRFGIVSGRSTHQDRLATIRMAWERWGIEIDPHTADGIKVGLERRPASGNLICLETALPAKFESIMVEALGRKPARPAGFDGIEDMKQHVTVLPADLERLMAYIETQDRD